MNSTNRASTLRIVAFGAFLPVAVISRAQQRDPIIDNIGKAYGVDSWNQIEAIRYTWNREIPGAPKLAHKWEWEPKTGKISYEGADKDGKAVKVTYDSSQLSSQSDQVKKEVEPAFVNDNYWLLFPLHAYWDKSAAITSEGTKKLPVGVGSATLVSVKYPAKAGGYTPGDTWDLYVGKDFRVQAMVYQSGGLPKHLVAAKWTGYKKAGPLLFSTEHTGTLNGKPLHIWMSDVAVKVTGSDQWINAQ